MSDPSAAVLDLLVVRGTRQYDGEPVSQCEHALQAAALAQTAGATPALIIAALLHDIGSMIDPGHGGIPAGADRRHEEVGAQWLARWFPPDVVEPVRWHVAAKRCLCTIDPAYRATLSAASEASLMLQGGPMLDEEVAIFQARPFATDAIRLRRWDDMAKLRGVRTPALGDFLPLVRQLSTAGRLTLV